MTEEKRTDTVRVTIKPVALGTLKSRSVDNVYRPIKKITPSFPQVSTPENQTIISRDDATIIKSKLFELCQQGDIERNDHVSFNEFASVIHNFLPDITDKKLQKMFGAFDSNNSGTVSYVEFLADENFNTFLQFCGYFTDDQTPKSTNKHTEEIIMAQDAIIAKLNEWITNVGKPAEIQCKQLQMIQIQNESLHQQLAVTSSHYETVKQELIGMNVEKESIQHELKTSLNDKDMLSHKLKHIKTQLQQSKDALEHYHKQESKWKEVQTENTNLQKEHVRLTSKIDDELTIINELERTTSQMQLESRHNLDKILNLNQTGGEYEDDIDNLKEDLIDAQHLISKKDAEIEHLKDQLRLKGADDENSSDGDQREISFQHTLRLDRFLSSQSKQSPLHTHVFNNAFTPESAAAIPLYHMNTVEYHEDAFHVATSDISDHAESEAKEMQWNQNKEDMKMEIEKLKAELMKMKEQMEEDKKSHDSEMEQLALREFNISSEEKSGSIHANILSETENEDEHAPFIRGQNVDDKVRYHPICCNWKCW